MNDSTYIPNGKVLLSEELRAGERERKRTSVSEQEAEAGTGYAGLSADKERASGASRYVVPRHFLK